MPDGGAVQRRSVRRVDPGEPIGSEPGIRRPVLIVSADAFNRSAIATVVGESIEIYLDIGMIQYRRRTSYNAESIVPSATMTLARGGHRRELEPR